MKKQNQKGFSLVELLVVVIIIGIIAAIAIPSLLASRKAANEASAISSLRTIHSAEITYFATQGANTSYTSDLGAGASPAATSLAGQGLIDSSLASGTKSGYTFAAGVGTGKYCAKAAPQSATQGTNSYGVSTDGVIYKGGASLGCGSSSGDLTNTVSAIQ